ncbi:MAG: hypothetical protein ABIQ59_05290 [Nocardioidaceae bacterium]
MNTEQHPWTSTPSVCGCGQDLDLCSGVHCPRCGILITTHAA